MPSSEKYDSAESDIVLRIFKTAWRATLIDYRNQRLNSERCLQASLYRHLCNRLPKEYRVFVEAVVLIPIQNDQESAGQPKSKFKRVLIDTLICNEQDSIVAAIEIKYAPRGNPDIRGIRKDLTSLSVISNWKEKDKRIRIELPRYLNADAQVLELNIHPKRKIIFAAYCIEDTKRLTRKKLWRNHRPDSGRWKSHESAPPQFGAALALTSKDGQVKHDFIYPAFKRLDAANK